MLYMQFLKKVADYFRTRGIGFYFTAVAVVMSLIQMIIYISAFTPAAWVSYMHWSVILFAVIAIVGGIALSIFDRTAGFAPALVTLMEFLSFLMFMRYGYMYFSQIFFSGVTLTLIFQMYYGYLGSLILYFLTFIVGIAAIFIRQVKVPASNAKAEVKA